MNKNNFIHYITKTNIAFFLAMCMLVCFFLSRGALSVTMILFGINALWNIHPKQWFRHTWWLLGFIWVMIFAISYFWSDDKAYWLSHAQVKLPLLLLPLSFGFISSFSLKQIQIYTLVLCGCLLSGITYSLYFFIQDPTFYIEGYGYSNILPTIPKNEHPRFTMALVLGFIWCISVYSRLQKKWIKLLTFFSIMVFFIAIHLLAVRSAILALYIFLAGLMIFFFTKKNTRMAGWALLVVFTLGIFTSSSIFPTLKKRIDHFRWTIMVFNKGEMNPNYGDIGRYISYDLALKIIQEHPLQGVGAGDMLDEMGKKYEAFYPDIPRKNWLVPHNQFLIVGICSGMIGMIAFIIWIFYPLKEMLQKKNTFYYSMVWLVLFIPIMVEPLLEIQYGIFIYLFFLLMQRHLALAPYPAKS